MPGGLRHDDAFDTRDGPRLVERITSQTVAHCQRSHLAQVVARDRINALIGGQCPCGAQEGQFSAQPVRTQSDAESRAIRHDIFRGLHRGKRCARVQDCGADLCILGLPMRHERVVVPFERIAATNDLDPLLDVHRGTHLDGQAEAVQQLGTKLSFLRVPRSDEHEARGMADRKTFAFDGIDPGFGHIEQKIDNVIFQQVDLVDVEVSAVGPRQKTGFEGFLAMGEHTLDVEGAGNPVFGHAKGQVHHRRPAFHEFFRIRCRPRRGSLRALPR